MKLNRNRWLSLSLFLLISCSGNDSKTTKQNPEGNPESKPENPKQKVEKVIIPKAMAVIKLGAIERNFNEQMSSVCLIDKSRNEAVVTFQNPENGASFSLRLLNVSSQKSNTHTLIANRARGVFYLSLGGDKNTNQFKMNSNSSACLVNYETTENNQMQGRFQCQNISNQYGIQVTADGNWLCNIQSTQDWSW